jgi:hypothetical protein
MATFKSVLRRLFRRPSHATVVAYLALFFAMSGTAYAAAKWTGEDIADGTLTGADVQDNSLSGADISSGSITSSDLAPGTIDSGGGSASDSLLGASRNPDTVTGQIVATDASSTQVTTSVSFPVPAGQHYQAQLSAQAVLTEAQPPFDSCREQSTWTGGGLGIYADADYSHNLIGYQSGGLPGGAQGGSQVVVFGPGDHIIEIAISPSLCQSVSDPGESTLTDSFLSVTLLAVYQ